jgi:CRP-like cAMP-binding protein
VPWRTQIRFLCYNALAKAPPFIIVFARSSRIGEIMPAAGYKHIGLKNHLLAALPDAEFERIAPTLEPVSLRLGKVLYESGDKMTHIYFPTTAIISLLYIMEDGRTAEIGIAGNNGLVGIALFMGGETTSSRAVVQSGGDAVRMKARDLQTVFALGGVFQNILLRYTQSFMTQISQTAVCNRLHTVEQQLCRWLLINHDQLESNKLIMTHDLIANYAGRAARGRVDRCRTPAAQRFDQIRTRYYYHA